MKIGFEISHCRNHIDAFYGQLVEPLKKEFAQNFEVFDSNDMTNIGAFDGCYEIVVVVNRRAANRIVNDCNVTKSFLIDHAPIHSNRARPGGAHFEMFSSPFIKYVYEGTSLRPKIKGYCGGYFLSEFTDTLHPQPTSCLVYLIHWKYRRANSHAETPFTEVETLALLSKLSQIFDKVYVVGHLCDPSGDFFVKYAHLLPVNIEPIQHGQRFQDLVCNVGALVFEYSSVFATSLWNPAIPLFQRVPKYPHGPAALRHRLFHQLMDAASYRIVADDLTELGMIVSGMSSDNKRPLRQQLKNIIYDEGIQSPTKAIIDALYDAMSVLQKAGAETSCMALGLQTQNTEGTWGANTHVNTLPD